MNASALPFDRPVAADLDRSAARSVPVPRGVALGGILLLAALLDCWRLSRTGLATTYSSGAITSMLGSSTRAGSSRSTSPRSHPGCSPGALSSSGSPRGRSSCPRPSPASSASGSLPDRGPRLGLAERGARRRAGARPLARLRGRQPRRQPGHPGPAATGRSCRPPAPAARAPARRTPRRPLAHATADGATTRFPLIVSQETTGAPVAAGSPVAALGGFSGRETVISASRLAAIVAAGEARYFLPPSISGGGPSGTWTNAGARAITTACSMVTGSVTGLYDCSGRAAAIARS